MLIASDQRTQYGAPLSSGAGLEDEPRLLVATKKKLLLFDYSQGCFKLFKVCSITASR